MAREYHFYIVDNEYGDDYHYYAFFQTPAEVLRFIRENLEAGNLIFTLDLDFIDAQWIDWDHGYII